MAGIKSRKAPTARCWTPSTPSWEGSPRSPPTWPFGSATSHACALTCYLKQRSARLPLSSGHTKTQRHKKHTNTQIHKHKDTKAHIHNDTNTHTQTHTDTHGHTDTHTRTHIHTDTQTHRHTDTQTHRHAAARERQGERVPALRRRWACGFRFRGARPVAVDVQHPPIGTLGGD